MNRITHRFFPVIFAFSCVLCLQALLAPAASAHTATGHIPAPGSRLYLMHVAFTGDVDYSGPNLIVTPGTGGTTTKTWTVSNQFGATLGISVNVVSAGVSFNVTESQSVSEACNVPTNTTGHDELLVWESVFAHYNYDIYSSATNTKVGTGWAEGFTATRCGLY
jgi:hypothetical protein